MAANVKNLPLSVIFAAKSGDGQALGAVLNHYQRYIQERLQTNVETKFIMLMRKYACVWKHG
jgi:hypothetical protein